MDERPAGDTAHEPADPAQAMTLLCVCGDAKDEHGPKGCEICGSEDCSRYRVADIERTIAAPKLPKDGPVLEVRRPPRVRGRRSDEVKKGGKQPPMPPPPPASSPSPPPRPAPPAIAEVPAVDPWANVRQERRPCSVENCPSDHWARGLCALHYSQAYRGKQFVAGSGNPWAGQQNCPSCWGDQFTLPYDFDSPRWHCCACGADFKVAA